MMIDYQGMREDLSAMCYRASARMMRADCSTALYYRLQNFYHQCYDFENELAVLAEVPNPPQKIEVSDSDYA